MRHLAWRAARNVIDDRYEMMNDLAQVGWVAYYEFFNNDPGIRWTAARYAMYHAWREWRFSHGQSRIDGGSAKKELKDFAPYLDRYIQLQDDFCFEDSVITNALCLTVERKLKETFRKPELHIKLFNYMLKYGQPNLEKQIIYAMGLNNNRKDKRVRDIRKILNELIRPNTQPSP